MMSLDKRHLIIFQPLHCLVFWTLHSLAHGTDILSYYMHILPNYIRISQAMAMPPRTYLTLEVFKIDNVMVYHHRHGCICIHETEQEYAGWSNNVHSCPQAFLGPDYLPRQAKDAKRKLQSPHYGEKKIGIGTCMSYSTKNSMPSWRALQITATVEWTMAPRSTTFSKASSVLNWKQQSMLSRPNQRSMEQILMQPYLGQMVIKNGASMQSVLIATTGIQQVKPKLVGFTGKIEYKKYPKAVWNSMTNEQQM